MIDCIFDSTHKCVNCGYQARRAGVRRNCRAPNPSALPSIFARVSSWATALGNWMAAGRPVRTDAEVEALATICESCDRYDPVAQLCKTCGCPAKRDGSAWRNKLRMATESCPLDPPLWQASPYVPLRRTADDRPRVGFVLPNLLMGGVERWLASLVKHLPAHGVEVAGIACTGGADDLHPEIVAELATRCPVFTSRAAVGAMALPVASEAIWSVARGSDLLVVWSITGAHLVACRATGVPLIGVSHGCGDWWMVNADPHIAQWVAVSEAAAGPCPRKPVVIDNGVELERLVPTRSREAVRIDAGIPLDARVVVSIGRISREKRLPLLAAALDRLPPDVWLWLVGDGPQSEVERIKAAAGAAVDRLVISHARQDIGNVLGAADCFAFASEAEGYGLAPVEALAAGVPLVSTRVGILPQLGDVAEWIGQDPTAGEVADAILASFALGRYRIDVARRLVTEVHSAGAMAERWSRFLKEVARVRPAVGASG